MKIYLYIIAVVIMTLMYISFRAIDSTDKSATQRSGMTLYIDNMTGCHYLGALFGGVTPRLDNTGKQVCTGYQDE